MLEKLELYIDNLRQYFKENTLTFINDTICKIMLILVIDEFFNLM